MIAARANELFEQHQESIHVRTDRLFGKLFILEYFFGIAAAVFISPRTWIGAQSTVHLHVIAAVVLGALLFSFPLLLIRFMPGRPVTRHVIAVTQMVFSALLIHLTGGRIETHFHVFGSLAFLGFYRDVKVLATASVVVALDHLLRGAFWPESVYGTLSANGWRWFEHTAWVVFEDVFLFLAISQSVREMKAIAERQAGMEVAEREIAAAKAKAEQANQAKSAFLANMSHEIRTPMNAILGFGDLLMDDGLTEAERLDYASRIRGNGDQLLQLIDDILDLSKIEAGKVRIEKLRFSIAELVNEVAQQLRPLAERKNLALEVEFRTPVPQVIYSDPVRLKQILTNLIGNAIKFTQAGRIEVRLSFEKRFLAIEVEDTGLGISSASQRELFRPFHQGDGSITRRFGGTGLGLALSRRLAAALEGSLSLARSEPGKGSCFRLNIETGDVSGVLFVTSPKDLSPVRSRPALKVAGARVKKLQGVKLLLAEDSSENETLIRLYLEREGAELTAVRNGQEAVETAASRDFDLVLMDIQMPEMDGLEATRRLRAGGFSKPILALTAHALREEVERSLQAGCDAHLTKPIERSSLVDAIKTRLQRQPNARIPEPQISS